MKQDYRIIYEDPSILVCEKPAGVPVQTAGYRTKDLVSMLKNHLAEQGENPYLAVVHRLDQPVQGVLVFAKTKAAAASLSAQMSGQDEKKLAKKIYLTVVCGKPEKKQDILTDYLLKDGRTNTSAIVPEGTKESKRAKLSYEVIGEQEDCSLLRVQLFSGRHHQIRVQMAGAGFPIAGDSKYGKQDVGAEGQREVPALCAAELTFHHPKTGKEMTFSCKPQGVYFQKFV